MAKAVGEKEGKQIVFLFQGYQVIGDIYVMLELKLYLFLSFLALILEDQCNKHFKSAYYVKDTVLHLTNRILLILLHQSGFNQKTETTQ